jgi:N-acetylmuramoyl-L-alanine amidase
MKGLFALVFLISFKAYSFVVLVDPGHGGKEYGAKSCIKHRHGNNVFEKDLALKLSKKLHKYLSPKYTTYLTRSFDRDVPLQLRAQMAEEVKADLFISLHFNSTKDSRWSGFEIYYLDNHNQAATKKVENNENFEMLSADKTVNQILLDLIISKTVESSKRLAKLIHKSVSQTVIPKYRIKDRGVKPGLFYVLALSKRPGVLIEAGFLSNKKEARKMHSDKILDEYAKNIAQGVDAYFKNKVPRDLSLF